jgi:hypothetical protein
MQLIQCHKCGKFDPTWDYAHVCGPVEVKPQMNKRIQELAEQAGYMKDSFGFGHWDMPECKKFVQLIAQECADLCDRFQLRGMEPGECAGAIRKMFGVE